MKAVELFAAAAETDLEAEVDPSVETEEKLRAEEEAAKQRLEAMQRCVKTLAVPSSHLST